MKKTLSLTLVFIGFALSLSAQIGHTTITFADPSRTGGFGSGGGPGRQIQTEIYYPAATTGDDVPVTGSNYPVIVFGHGFVMVWSAYQNIWEALVAQGYIVAFPRTEGGLPPSHGDFGLDLAYVAEQIQIKSNNDPAFFFYQKTAPTTALMGHSMGGGAALLGAQNNPNITAVAVLAAAETNPSAVAACAGINVPSLVFAGANDCVTPPPTNQVLMYNALSSKCKTYISITGASHCQFADDNFNCNFGEITCSPSPAISRAQQHASLETYLIPFMNKYLKGTCAPNSNFDALLTVGTDITYNQTCGLQAGGDATVCAGSPVTLGSTIMDGYTFNWTSNPAGYTATTATPTVTPQSTTTYILNYTNLQSNCAVIDSITVTVNPSPTASAGSNTTLCTGNTLNLGVAPTPSVSYAWLPATNLSSASAANPVFTPTQEGSFEYILTASIGSCTAKDTINLTVLTPPAITALSNQTLCPGAPAQLNVNLTPFVPTTFSATAGNVNIADNSPGGGVAANNTLPTTGQLAGRANKTVTVPTGSYSFKGITLSITHGYNQDLDIYLVSPNSQVYLISTDNGGNGDGYNNVTFNDAAATVPPTANTTFTNVSYKPEGATFVTYTGPVNGTWTLYAVDDALFDSGTLTDFKVNVLELPTNLTYTWSPNTGLNNASIQNPVSTATQNNNYAVVAGYLSCSVTDTVAVNRFTLPVANAGTDATTCAQAPITIGTPAVNGISYAWQSAPAGFTAITAQATVQPTQTTTYYLTVTDGNTCTNSDTVVVAIGAANPAVITPQGATTFCSGGSVTLNGNVLTNPVWLPNGETTQNLTVDSAGTYGLVSEAGTPCADTSYVSVVVNLNPQPMVFGDWLICPNDSVILTGASGFVSYVWNPGGETTQDIWANFGGPSYYEQIATDTNGCQGVVAQYSVDDHPANFTTIIQQGDSLILSPNPPNWQYQWYFNGEPINNATEGVLLAQNNGDYYVSILDNNGCRFATTPYTYIKGGLINAENATVNIYPNPATDKLFISLKNNGPVTLNLIDYNGRLVSSTKVVNNLTEIDLKGLAAGLYLLQVITDKGVSTYKVIKE
ncbi:MAG: T9SS type A sorting domain-containing protein [Sphingobacteriales bacterium JAD_PAG50586_3]|nr:MAG: T9SS type A sorting domain-containing protein [Sphingobacteriales bacterium JAD_PAG50586_3]